MSLLDSASLVVTPNGYKASKLYSIVPSDGTGDMSFSRTGDTATRVNSAGIIEINRTNLALQSNVFSNASWSKNNVTITSGQTDPNSGTTASLLAGSSSTSNGKSITQTVFTSTVNWKTISIYVKANTHNFIQLNTQTHYGNFDLVNGTFSGSALPVLKMTSIGSGWYRCSMSVSTGNTGFQIWLVDSLSAVNGEASTTTNSVYIWRAQAELGDIPTSYIDTTTAAVTYGGPLANVPRLDYLGKTCPTLLLEPQRTNVLLNSSNPAFWGNANVTITNNTITTPSGYINGDLIVGTAGTNIKQLAQTSTVTGASGDYYTFSVFLKYQAETNILIRIADNGDTNGARQLINIQTGTLSGSTTLGGTATNGSAKIEDYGNGWFRCSITCQFNASFTSLRSQVWLTGFASSATTNGVYVWGGQTELGSYATSYIETFGASVTRNADSCTKTSASALIGQTEGTFFFDINLDSRLNYSYIMLRNSAVSMYIGVYITDTILRMEVRNSGSTQASIAYANTSTGRFKCALGYKENDFVFYVNGNYINADTSGTVPAVDIIDLYYNNTNGIKLNASALWKTRLQNADLAALTTI